MNHGEDHPKTNVSEASDTRSGNVKTELTTCRNVDSFTKFDRIGEGTYGLVYRAIDKTTNKLVALKRIIMHNEKSDGFPITTLREISSLKKVSSHPNCVELLDIAVGSKRDSVFLVFEYCEHDMSVLIRSVKDPFKESEAKTLARQLLSAVAYIHDKGIIHRDIKVANLLYNHKGQLKLADFGLARRFARPVEPMTQKVVSLWYRCPELLMGESRYTPAVDNWAVGCVIAELLRFKPLLAGNNETEQIKLIFSLLGAPNVHIWPEVCIMPLVINYSIDLEREQAIHQYSNLPSLFMNIDDSGQDLLMRLLAYDPNKRMKAKVAIEHKYFDTSPYPKSEALMPTFRSFHQDMHHESLGYKTNSISSSSSGGNSHSHSHSTSKSKKYIATAMDLGYELLQMKKPKLK